MVHVFLTKDHTVIALISAATVKTIRALATTLTNYFCSAANLMSPFLWLGSILQSPELTNGTDKGHLLESNFVFSISFQVVWDIREGKLL